MNTEKQNGFRPGSKPGWRKRLASVSRYIDDMENRLARAYALTAAQERVIQELRQHIQYKDSLLGTGIGDQNEKCCSL